MGTLSAAVFTLKGIDNLSLHPDDDSDIDSLIQACEQAVSRTLGWSLHRFVGYFHDDPCVIQFSALGEPFFFDHASKPMLTETLAKALGEGQVPFTILTFEMTPYCSADLPCYPLPNWLTASLAVHVEMVTSFEPKLATDLVNGTIMQALAQSCRFMNDRCISYTNGDAEFVVDYLIDIDSDPSKVAMLNVNACDEIWHTLQHHSPEVRVTTDFTLLD
jgi:hypothetical protein